MQYAVIQGRTGKRIVDALEFTALQAGTIIEDEPVDEAAFRWHVAYGAFRVQPDKDPDETAAELLTYQGSGFGRITSGGTCRRSEVREIELFGFARVGHAVLFPCAALLGTTEDIPSARGFALSLFPRFVDQMDPLTNILNRPGILALKGEEKRAVRQLNPNPSVIDWRGLIKPERVLRLAMMDVEGHA